MLFEQNKLRKWCMMKCMRKYLLVLFFVFVVVVAVGSFVAVRFRTAPPPSLRKTTLQLNWVPQAQFAGVFVAREKGFYREVGLDVEIKNYEEDLDQTRAVAEGKSDFGISTGTEVIVAIASGVGVRSVAAIYNTTPESFISLASSSIRSPADFRGKVLGIKGGNKEGRALYEALLAQAGLESSEVTFKNLDYSQTVPEDLANGRADVVDAYRTDETYQMEKAGLAYTLIAPETHNIEVYGDTIITSPALIAEDPELVARFVSATLRGWEYALSHEDEAVEITLPYAHADYTDVSLETNILKESIPLVKPTRGSVVGMMHYAKWNKAVRQLEAAGLITVGLVDAKDVYTTKFLPGE